MKNYNVIAGMLTIAVCLFLNLTTAHSQTGKLGIGDDAPELRYSKWIKGEPVKSFEGDKLYILEFWATWCGPCKAAMPHITKLQAEYKDEATFIGVNVWEKLPGGAPYETSLPSVVKYVDGNDANMGYSVIADNNEQYMGNKWLKASGQNGIPATFIVKGNKILWIGHPNSLDTIIPKVLTGKYDMQASKIENEKIAEAGRALDAKMAAQMNPINDAIKAKEFSKAFELIENVKVENPDMSPALNMMKFGILLDNFPLTDAQKFASEWQTTYKSAPSLILSIIYVKPDLSKEAYLWAVTNFGSTAELTNPLIFDALATCYAKAGDFKNAAVNQEKALGIARKALKEGTMVGSIMDYTVTEYEGKLKKYKNSSL